MTKIVTTVITCDECKKEINTGYWEMYFKSPIDILQISMHFCDFDHMCEYLLKRR